MPIARINLLVLLVLLVVLLLSSCASQHANNQQRYTLPNLDRIKDSARQAFTSKHTWIPLLGAALFSINDFDEQTLEWASEKNPIFGDIENAKDWSDALVAAAEVNWLVTAVMAQEDSISRGRRLILQGLTLSANQTVTSWMKSEINRTRPDRPDKQNSFPSLHASSAMAASTLATQNIKELDVSDSARKAWQWSSFGVAGLTAWARVEGNRHYPSDVLFGYALGHFIADFLNNAFALPEDKNTLVFSAASLAEDGFVLSVHYDF